MLKIYGSKEHGYSGAYEPAAEHYERLAHCPFCGESADLRLWNTHTACYSVSCDNCGGEMQGGFPKGYGGGRIGTMSRCASLHALALEQAIERWNQRAASQPPGAATPKGGE